jgi:hypothetical protein
MASLRSLQQEPNCSLCIVVRLAQGIKGDSTEIFSRDAVGGLGESEEVLANLFLNQAGEFQFKVSALNFTFIDSELLRQRGRGGERCSRGDGLISDLSFNLLAHLRVHGALGQFL